MNRKFMKNTNIYIATILIFVFGCSIAKNYSDSQVRGNGKSISEIRDLKEFTEIMLHNLRGKRLVLKSVKILVHSN